MKNYYAFEKLNPKEFILGAEKQHIFLNMLDIVCNGNLTLFTQSFSNFVHLFQSDSFYIAHNLIYYKGKKAICKGHVVKALKNQLIDFIQYTINHDDLRSFLITPIIANPNNKQVFYLTEEGFYLYEISII
ncbi:hypothetical protein A9G28_06220 [Gilliamella sp. Fer1-1]|uniref:hypothetical protein n=1 Tax=Gilliamella sp. Fer1-1 TaxID=3120240 RepID=UPI00080D9A87|nr:hypothetical protein [Gilliamella apicola]OCG41383.1 hypothetical protein A9G28_06220 [Gilliamella apicola]